MASQLAPDWTLDRFVDTIHRGRVGLWSWDPDARTARFDALATRFWDGLASPEVTLDQLFGRIDERDREAARSAWLASARTDRPYEFDFRVPQSDGTTRWISARGLGGEEGRSGGDVLAVFVDVTAQHEAQEAMQMLVGEMGHRISNLFSVASAITALAAREAEDPKELARDLQTRFQKLQAAFTFAMSGSTDGLGTVPAAGLIAELTGPYDLARIRIDLPPDVVVSGKRITDFALIFHELATNSAKYGAFARPEGSVAIEGRVEGGCLRMVWREAGGPPLDEPPQPKGFGSRLLEHAVTAVFGGRIDRAVESGALRVVLDLDTARLAAA